MGIDADVIGLRDRLEKMVYDGLKKGEGKNGVMGEAKYDGYQEHFVATRT